MCWEKHFSSPNNERQNQRSFQHVSYSASRQNSYRISFPRLVIFSNSQQLNSSPLSHESYRSGWRITRASSETHETSHQIFPSCFSCCIKRQRNTLALFHVHALENTHDWFVCSDWQGRVMPSIPPRDFITAYLKNSLLGPPLSKASSPANSIWGFLVQEKFLLHRAPSALFRRLFLQMVTCTSLELRCCCWNALSKDVTSVSS